MFGYNILPSGNRNQYFKNQINIIIITYKIFCFQKCKKSACYNGRTGNDYIVAALPNSYWNHHAKFEIDRTIITCLN